MYPITPIGRILSCLCALFDAAIMDMLISVLADRYQRVYNRKKFLLQQEAIPINSLENQQNQTQNILMKKFLTSTTSRSKFTNHDDYDMSGVNIESVVLLIQKTIH
jgi:hypothetical protein